MNKLSIIVPVYFNEGNLIPLYRDMREKALCRLSEAGYDYEIVFVDDGSEDRSYEVMRELAEEDSRIVNVRLSRNFGSHAAILAGLSVCSGCCAMMKAADLQEPSELILTMLEEFKKGNQVVLAVREDREDAFSQKLFAGAYYAMVRRFALKNMPKGGFDCFLIGRKVIDVLNAMEEKNTTLMGQILWSGFRPVQIGYTRKKREIGKSRWTLKKKVKLVMDSLFGFSYFPVQLISVLGFAMFVISGVWALFIVISRLAGKISVSGYSTLAAILLGGFGLVMLSLGVLGQYIWRIFDAARKRPVYIIEDGPERGTQTEETEGCGGHDGER